VSVVQGARLAHARTIIGVDIAGDKLEWAKQFGATHTVDARNGDPVEHIKSLTDGNGVDYSFESAGRTDTLEQAIWCRDLAGTCVMIGVHGPDAKIELPLADSSVWEARCVFHVRRLPTVTGLSTLCDLYLKKQLMLDEV